MSTPTDSGSKKTRLFNGHTVAPVIWLIMLYVATALMAGVDKSPESGIDLILFEGRHVAIHMLAYAIEAWLIASALGLVLTARNRLWLVVLVLLLGIGQEALQALYRHEVRAIASLWDVGVDVAGGLVGWWYRQQRIKFPLQSSKGVGTDL